MVKSCQDREIEKKIVIREKNLKEREREQRSGGGEKKLRKQRTRERQERQWEDEWKKKKRESNILITSPHIYLNKKKRENLREENKRKGKVERRGE